MQILRTRFAKDIVAEFLPPRKKSSKVVILCDGMPTVPFKRPLLEFFAKKGYWVFHPRYRGSWESSGKFLKISLEKDILDVVSSLPRGFTDLGSGERYRIKPSSIYLIASSFGGPAGILASRNPRVTKVVAVCPIVDVSGKLKLDWRAPSKAEPLSTAFRFAQNAFGEAYRISKHSWNKLKTGKFYNPMAHIEEIDGGKILIFHAKDDESVSWQPVVTFAKRVGAKIKLLKKGGHLKSAYIVPKYWKQISKFLLAK